MKFTQDFVEYRQLHIEDYLLDNTVEQEGKAEVYRSLEMNERIDTNSIIVQGLLGDILSVDNLNEARKRVKKNKGSHGIDKMLVSEMDAFMLEHGVELRNALLNGAGSKSTSALLRSSSKDAYSPSTKAFTTSNRSSNASKTCWSKRRAASPNWRVMQSTMSLRLLS